MQFHLFSYLLLACGSVAILISLIIFGKVGKVVRSYAYLTMFISIWALAYGFELACTTFEQMRFWVNVEYVGISFLPGLFLIFILRYTGREKWITQTRLWFLFGFATLTLLMVWTDKWHHLYYASVSVDHNGPFPMLAVKMGFWYAIHIVYFYTIILFGYYLILRTFYKANGDFKRQNYIIILGTGFPWLINIFYILEVRPYKHLDLTPMAFLGTSLLIGIGLLRFRLFDIVPIARDKVFDELNDGVMVLDAQDRVVDLNASMKKILLQNEQIPSIGKYFQDYFPLENELHSLVEKRIDITFDLKLGKLANVKYYAIHLYPLFDKKTFFSGLIVSFSDITSRKLSDAVLQQQAKDLQEMNQLKDRLFSIISHDLRSPILSLNEIMRLMEERIIDEKDFRDHVPLMASNIKSTAALLENLLYWSRSQLKGDFIRREPLNVNQVVQRQIDLLDSQAKLKNIRIENLIREQAAVLADKNMTEMVFRNLISNAIKFSMPEALIRISAQANEKVLSVSVQDQGVGISEENQNRLFGTNNFSSLGTNNEPGTGLGLLLCKDFVEKNGGSIEVFSKLNEGSTFTVTLPLA